jgi:hypothetical protein
LFYNITEVKIIIKIKKMAKKSLVAIIASMACVLVLTGCVKNTNNQNGTPAGGEDETAVGTNGSADSGQTGNVAQINSCKEEKVNLSNYGDPGQRLKNCFVKYPGEPTRQDKSYYIVEDICGQFTKEFIENILGAKITKMEPSKVSSVYTCSYYLDDKEYFTLNLEYLSVENQKKGNEFAGRKTEKNAQIPIENLVVWQEDNLINVIYLVLNPNKFISIRPNSKETVEKDEFLNFAAKLGEAIKGYK